jgi:hypothetical protein
MIYLRIHCRHPPERFVELALHIRLQLLHLHKLPPHIRRLPLNRLPLHLKLLNCDQKPLQRLPKDASRWGHDLELPRLIADECTECGPLRAQTPMDIFYRTPAFQSMCVTRHRRRIVVQCIQHLRR